MLKLGEREEVWEARCANRELLGSSLACDGRVVVFGKKKPPSPRTASGRKFQANTELSPSEFGNVENAPVRVWVGIASSF
jgi:hypothetical protein